MPPGKTFSGKQKKEQLKEKRERKRQQAAVAQNNSTDNENNNNDDRYETTVPYGSQPSLIHSSSVSTHPSTTLPTGRLPKGIPHELLTTSLGTSNTTQNKLSTILAKEKTEWVEARRIASAAPIDTSPRNHPLYARDRHDEHTAQRNTEGQAILDHPKGVLLREGKRGRSTYTAVDARAIEEQTFHRWLQNIYTTYTRNDLNMFEHNLDVWMQLWHTLATADIIAILADVRNPLWHIPYSLYHQIIQELRKPLIIVLSKCDLVPNEVSEAWCTWMNQHYPEAKVVRFTASGGYVGDITALAQRKRQLRNARLAHEEYHVNRRIQSAKDFLQAANVPAEAIEYVERKLRGTMKQTVARSNVKLSVDTMDTPHRPHSAVSSVSSPSTVVNTDTNTGITTKEDNKDDEGKENESDDDDDRSFDMVQIYEHSDEDEEEEEEDNDDQNNIGNNKDDETITNEDNEDTVPEMTDKTEENKDEDDEETNGGSSSTSSSSDGFLRNPRFDTKSNANNRKKPIPSTTSAKSETTQPNTSTVAKKKHKNKRKGKRSDSSDEGIDRFAGRPRHYKRGDADVKANEIAEGFRQKVSQLGIGPEDSDDDGNGKKGKKNRSHKQPDQAKAYDRSDGKTRSLVPKPTNRKRDDDNDDNEEDNTNLSTGPTEEELARDESLANPSSTTVKRPLTIGFVGHPNVGKSSIINTLCSENKVSVSRTAGHTKRAQTIHLVPAHPGIEPVDLLDCPGLVFPHLLNYLTVPDSIVTSSSSTRPTVVTNGNETVYHDENERAMQECCGVIPLAQVREPYTSIRFLMEHLPLERYYGISPPRDEVREAQEEGREFRWSALSFCEAYAVKRGYYIARTGRPDSHSAGRSILYDCQDGIIPLWWLPPKPKDT